MVPYDKQVMHKLLDTYESSILSTGENERTIHIEVKFTKTFLPTYFDESSGAYESIHILMRRLEEDGLIQIIWKDRKVNHIIQKVRLKIEKLEMAYAYVKRTPKSELVGMHLELFSAYLKEADRLQLKVSRNFVAFLKERLEKHKSVKEFIHTDDIEENKRLLWAVRAVEENEKPLYVREFSILNFHDSKVFEQLVGKVHHIFSKFDENYNSNGMTEWLAEHQIYQTPNFVYLKGNARILVGNEEMDLSMLHHGVGISGEDIERIEILNEVSVKKVITIENLTTYFRWQEAESLIIYLGGYHNGIRRNLLRKIYEAFPKVAYYHFGDIDAGGFEIYRCLCDKTGIPFQMYQMDLQVLKRYECFGKKLTMNDRKRLQDLKNIVNGELKELVTYMLDKDVKLEQECVGFEKRNE